MPLQRTRAKQHASGPTTEALTGELSVTGKQLNSTRVDFLKVDVETALTFTGLALGTEDQEKKQRNRANARKAYDTILRLSRNVLFTAAEEAYMKQRLEQLKTDLARLGERL